MKSRHFLFLVAGVLAFALASRALLGTETRTWARVETRDLVIGIPFEGELEAVGSVALTPPMVERLWNFKISFLASDGKVVRRGEPVARFDTTELEKRLQQKISDRDSAEKELEKRFIDLEIRKRDLKLEVAEAEAELRRVDFEAGIPADLVAENELAVAEVDRRMARRTLENLRRSVEFADKQGATEIANLEERRNRAAREVEELEKSIQAMTVTAPREGTVILRTSRNRQKLKVGDQAWRGYTVLEIPDLNTMRVEAQVAEADSGRLAVGLPVTFRLDAHPDREYSGRVESIRRAVQAKSNVHPEKIVKALLSVEKTDTERMRPGMRLQGTVEIERINDVLAIPKEAVFADAEGPWVWSKGLLGKERVEVELGRRNDRYFEVLDGLRAGDAVALPDTEENP